MVTAEKKNSLFFWNEDTYFQEVISLQCYRVGCSQRNKWNCKSSIVCEPNTIKTCWDKIVREISNEKESEA